MRASATVSEIQELAPDVLQLTVSLGGEPFSFRPGQWLNLEFTENVSRAYAIASAPQRPGAIQIVVRMGSGKGAEEIRKLAEGSTVTLDGPYGQFVLPDDDDRPIVLIAGDVGIAPIRSLVLDLLARRAERSITVLYEPNQRYVLYASDFDPLARAGHIVYEAGPIATLVGRNRLAFGDAIVMAAGFSSFLERAKKALGDIDQDTGKLIVESFGREP
ncbi:MAG: FAD-dependent oxidoreductase [Thermoanaerobaculia bacterium]